MEMIAHISFPNTVLESDRGYYTSKGWYTFEYIEKEGEMAPIKWIRVFKEWKRIAEIKESVCDIYFI